MTRVVPIAVPVDRLAVAAYLSHTGTVLKNTGKLDPDRPAHEQITPFAEIPEVERAGWFAAVQAVLAQGGTLFCMTDPSKLAILLGQILVDEVKKTYPIRQIGGDIRLPGTPDDTTWQMFGQITARILGAAKLTIPAVVTKGELTVAITPTGDDDVGQRVLQSEAAVIIPRDCYRAMLACGFKEGEQITIAVMEPHWDRPISDSMKEETKGGPH